MNAYAKGSDAQLSWLPRGFSFLSGLPTAARKRRLLMPTQIYVDESGFKGHARYFVMAGLMARSESWALFSDEWLNCLKESPSLRVFKMKTVAAWPQDQRDKKLRALLDILKKHATALFVTVVDLDAHQRTWSKDLPKKMNGYYFLSFIDTILHACFGAWNMGERERFDMIFDEQEIFGRRAREFYPLLRKHTKSMNENVHSIMPTDLMFRPDNEFVPIQASDMCAWLYRHRFQDPDDRTYDWIFDELKPMIPSWGWALYDDSALDHRTIEIYEGAIEQLEKRKN